MIQKKIEEKKRSEATQTLRAGRTHGQQTHKHTNIQGRLQYTAQLSAQCKQDENLPATTSDVKQLHVHILPGPVAGIIGIAVHCIKLFQKKKTF